MTGIDGESGRDRNPSNWRLGPTPPISRRTFMALAGGIGAGTALGAFGIACETGRTGTEGPTVGPGQQIRGPIPGPQPVSGGQRGGRIVVGYNLGEPVGFDPALAGFSTADWDAAAQLAFFGGLFAFDQDSGGPVPNVAEDYEISSDEKTLTITIRSGWKFHNGREIEAADAKYSLERMIQLPKAWASSYFSSVVGYQPLVDGKAKTMEGFEVKDSQTFVVHFTEPEATFLNLLSLVFSALVPREEVERLGGDFGRQVVGYGPYRLDRFDEVGQRAIFTRFDDYFYQGLPYLDEIEMRWGLNPQLMLAQVESGEIDIAGDGDPVFLRQAAADPTLDGFVQTNPILQVSWASIFPTYPPLDDVKVRQALNWAVDRSQIQKITAGASTGLGYPFPEKLGIPHLTEGYGYDTDKAKQLLAEAGVPDGFETTLAYDKQTFGDIAEFLQQQLGEVGVKLNLKEVPDVYEVESGASEPMVTAGWFMSQPEASDIYDSEYVTGGSFNYGGYSNPELDNLAKQSAAEFDRDKRFAIDAQIEKIIMADAPKLWLMAKNWISAKGPRVDNYHFRGETQTYFDRIWVSS